jgi:hypothetical protein
MAWATLVGAALLSAAVGLAWLWPDAARPMFNLSTRLVGGSSGLTLSLLVLALALMGCAIGLMRRLEWARRAYIGLTATFVLWSLWASRHLMDMPGNGLASGDQGAMGTPGLMGLAALAGVVGWAIAWLVREPVRREFG